MAEALSTVAGVASLVDVALRGCSALYGSIRYLRDLPELSLRLKRKVGTLESILQSVEDFVSLYRQQQGSAGLPSSLPQAVSHELIAIKSELDELSNLLSNSGSGSELRRRLKSVVDRKKVEEVVQRLDSHQITLSLALQTYAQRNGIRVHEDLTGRLAQIGLQNQDTIKHLEENLDQTNTAWHSLNQTSAKILPAYEHHTTILNDLHGFVSAGQNATSNKLDAIQLSLSHERACRTHVQSSAVLTASTEDVLARMFRAECLGIIVPTVQQCFDKIKTNSDDQLDEIRRKIDVMAQQFGSASIGNEEHQVKTAYEPLPEPGDVTTHNGRDFIDEPISLDDDFSAFNVVDHRIGLKSRRVTLWKQSWIYHWTVGTLWVTISTIATKRKNSAMCYTGDIPCSQKACRVTIEFLPAQYLVQLRGLTLSVAKAQDLRGYYQISPLISTFAVISRNADVIRLAKENDVEGIQNLFRKGLAAPSDRDEHGRTSLMHAAIAGAAEAYRLLLDEGSDPLVVDAGGFNTFDHINRGYFEQSGTTRRPFLEDEDRFMMLRLLLQAENDAMVDSSNSRRFFILSLMFYYGRLRIYPDLPYIQQLKDIGFRLDEDEDDVSRAFWFYRFKKLSHVAVNLDDALTILRTLHILGVDTSSWDHAGGSSLHGVLREITRTLLLKRHPEAEDQSIYINYECPPEEIIPVASVLITAFVEFGIDLCALDGAGNSIFDLEESLGLPTFLHDTLERAGCDVEEVQNEIERRKSLLKNPGRSIGESTAVDDTEIASPSTEGLFLRKAARGDRLEC